MKLWSCPACGREFGRTGQSHFCIPAMTVEGYFGGRPSFEREVYAAVAEVLMACGPVHVEAVGVGILFKKRVTFVELRPMRGRLRLSFIVARRPADARIVRRIALSGGRTVCYVDLRDALDVDDEVRGWLVESYADSPE